MYPLYSWTYEEICARYEKLLENDLYIEAIVASAQTIEQITKRILKQWMTVERLGYQKRNANGQKVVSIELKKDRDAILKSLQGIIDIKLAWNAIVARDQNSLRLDKLTDQVVGPNSWCILTSNKKIRVTAGIGIKRDCSVGLFQIRHQLVHGTHAPPKSDIEVLGNWGAEAVVRILDPARGFGGYLEWDPQSRIRPFRERKNGKA